MFEANNEEKKLDWMYKGPGSSIDREEYLLGRSVDKSLEQLNVTEKLGSDVRPPKNHVEHECIPPSIRDFQNLTSGEQVDLAQKLQEDPLVAIKKQEEETRRKLLQNPVQMKKLQDVLKMKSNKSKKKKKNKRKCKKSKSDSEDIDAKLAEKYLKLKDHLQTNKKHSKSKKKDDLDYLIGKKIKSLREKLSKRDLEKLLNMNSSSTDSSDEESSKHSKSKRSRSHTTESDNPKKHSHMKRSMSSSDIEDVHETKSQKHINEEEFRILNSCKTKSYRKRHDSDSSDDSNEQHYIRKVEAMSKSNKNIKDHKYKSHSNVKKDKDQKRYDHPKRSRSHSLEKRKNQKRHQMSVELNEDEFTTKKIVNYGLVKADGSKIPFKTRDKDRPPIKRTTDKETQKYEEKKIEKYKRSKMSEEEMERRRKEMRQNAEWRDKERASNIKKYKDHDRKETKTQEYNPDFLKSELLKSANSSTVESRIKSNINNIQRSKKDMNSHFSRRY